MTEHFEDGFKHAWWNVKGKLRTSREGRGSTERSRSSKGMSISSPSILSGSEIILHYSTGALIMMHPYELNDDIQVGFVYVRGAFDAFTGVSYFGIIRRHDAMDCILYLISHLVVL
jgi:hypothetical protein